MRNFRARGADVSVGAGETQLSLTRGLDKALRQEGVTLEPLGPAKLQSRELTLPVASGAFDPDAGSGTGPLGRAQARLRGKAVALRDLTLPARV